MVFCMEHIFQGKWITTAEFAALTPKNVFHRQLEAPAEPPDTEHLNRHVLYRKRFHLDQRPASARMFISADDHYKLWINGAFIAEGPAPAYHFRYGYNVLDIDDYLRPGENVIAVHTLYQGLVNRVWQSGDLRHGLILDLVADVRTIVQSDATFRIALHTGFRATGTVGYATQFLEEYDAGAPEVGFESPDFDDATWVPAVVNEKDDHVLVPQKSHMLVYERIAPQVVEQKPGLLQFDFGGAYVGYLQLTARGHKGDRLTVRCGQELLADGGVRFDLRANCRYEETWILGDGESRLDWFDYKSFRYAEILLPEGAEVTDASLVARHHPFTPKVDLKPEWRGDPELEQIWALCLRSQKYGVQEVIQDCMEREKGFYLGDGCYTVLTNLVLTGDDSLTRKMIDDAFASSFITETLVTCLDCSFMQEIAEYPLMLVNLVLWHYNLCGDRAYLAANYPKVVSLLEAYRREYEKDGLLRDLDKWCVVEWPKNFQQGYDIDIREGKVCHPAHVALNAYYIAAIDSVNSMASVVGEKPYRDATPLRQAFTDAFYLPDKHLCRDGEGTDHVTFLGNVFPFGFGVVKDEAFDEAVLALYQEKGIDSLSFFASFVMLQGLVRRGRHDLVREALRAEGAWRRMLREGATATYEGWGRDTKWNTSLFHLTLSYAAIFLANVNLDWL